MNDFTLRPIAIIKTDFKEKFGIPRQSGRIESAKGTIIFNNPYNDKNAIKGIENYSHLWLIFDFSLSHSDEFSPTVRPPRLGGNKRIGVFATRSPFRPNSLGLSSVKLEKVNQDGSLTVSGVDLLDNTPIFDIKPYIPYTDIHIDATAGFAEENKNHRLNIISGEELLLIIPADKRETVIDCICDDPRPSYQDDNNRIYNMVFSKWDIHFKVDNENVVIIGVNQI